MNETTTIRTLENIMADANAKVKALNDAKATTEQKIGYEAELDKFIKEYNELSLFTVYSDCKEHDLPIIALAKKCTYATLSKKSTPSTEVIDGVPKRVVVFSINEKESDLNVLKFIKWLEDRNFKMPKGWQARMSAVKADIIDQWQSYDKSGEQAVFNFSQLKRLLQPMVDDMGIIKGEKGNNALIAKTEHAKFLLKYANRKTGVTAGETLTPKIWDGLLMSVLHSISLSKPFENTYGGAAVYKEEVVVTPTEAEAEAEASAK